MVKGGDSYYGLLQAFADALKLILKEYVAPTQANTILFFLGPVITLAFALLGYGVVPWSVVVGIQHNRVKQSNSGELLKILVLNYSWKTICGWSNYSGIVISQNIHESGMDNRGSKSVKVAQPLWAIITVKEQRIYGCLYIIPFWLKPLAFTLYHCFLTITKSKVTKKDLMYIRFILVNFERNSVIKTLSKQLNIKKLHRGAASSPCPLLFSSKKAQVIHSGLNKLTYSTLLSPTPKGGMGIEKPLNAMNPWFIVGFTDAEGCFMVSITKNPVYNTGWEIQLSFQIKLHKRDLALLENIRISLGQIGHIGVGKDSCVFRVRKFDQVLSLIEFFDKYSLISQKKADYLLFKKVALIMLKKEHLTDEGLLEIVKLRASLNLGLTEALKLAFPDIGVINRPIVIDQKVPHPQWMAGFTSGEGNFQVVIKDGQYKGLAFKINQHERDEQLIRSFISYFGCGNYYSGNGRGDFKVTKFRDISSIIVPFFKENPIVGIKSLDFEDWCLVVQKVEVGIHRTPESALEICKIKGRMNTGRK